MSLLPGLVVRKQICVWSQGATVPQGRWPYLGSGGGPICGSVVISVPCNNVNITTEFKKHLVSFLLVSLDRVTK